MSDKKLEFMIDFIKKTQEIDFKNFIKALISIETECVDTEILEGAYNELMKSSDINLINERIREFIYEKFNNRHELTKISIYRSLVNGLFSELQNYSIDWSDKSYKYKIKSEILNEIDKPDFKDNLKEKIEEFFNVSNYQ